MILDERDGEKGGGNKIQAFMVEVIIRKSQTEWVVTPEKPRETMPAVACTIWVIYIDIIRRSRRSRIIVARQRRTVALLFAAFRMLFCCLNNNMEPKVSGHYPQESSLKFIETCYIPLRPRYRQDQLKCFT